MIRNFLLYCFISFSLLANGQKAGISLGLNSSNLGEFVYEDYSYKNLTGLNTGVMLIFPKSPLMNIFSFETGVYLSGKNSKSTHVFDFHTMRLPYYRVRTIDEITKLKYLEIPFLIKPSFKVKEARLFFSFGAYYAIGLNGTIETKENNTSYTRKIKWDASDPDFYDFKKKDIGLMAVIGFEMRSFQVSFTFERGFINVHNEYNSFNTYRKNYISSFSLALTFFIINRK